MKKLIDTEITPTSPKWSNSTKIIVTLLILAGLIALLIRFSNLLNTLAAAFIIAVLYHPMAEWVHRKTNIPWAWSVSIIYLVTVVILFGLLTVGGISLVNQTSGLIKFLQNTLNQLPQFFENITSTDYSLGPFKINFNYIDWGQVGNQLLATIEPILTRVGNIVGGIATSAVGVLGSLMLSLLISFLIITETGGVRNRLMKFEIPGYQEDFRRLGEILKKIWNEFVRGQALIFLFRFFIYLIILSIFRMRFVLGLALLATLGNFIPYVGVAIVWIIIFFVALFQGTTILSLNPFPYALAVMGVGWITDNLYDTFFSPRIMANVLKLHPATVLIAVLVGLNLFGILGMFLAPPLIASLKVLLEYSEKKLLDQSPWESPELNNEIDLPQTFFERVFIKLSGGFQKLFGKKDKEQ